MKDEKQQTVASPIEPVVSVPTEWYIETSGGAKVTYFKGLTLQEVIDSFYEGNESGDQIVKIKNLAHITQC